MTFALESQDRPLGRARRSVISPFLRFPSQRPQKGTQFVINVDGREHPASRDDHFDVAVGWSPAAFIKSRVANLMVELGALWVRVPELDRDPADLAKSIGEILQHEGVPQPDLIVREGVRFAGLGQLVCIWRIEPFRRPRKTAPEAHHQAFHGGLKGWRNALVKLSYALEPLGARPVHVVEALGMAVEMLPLPLEPTDPLAIAAEGLFDDPPRLIWRSDVPVVERRVVDISKPLARFDSRLFDELTAYGLATKRGRRSYRASEMTREALATLDVGKRHAAAVTIACACVWDGLNHEQTLGVLRAWQERVVHDGKFPDRRGGVDEVELIVRWAVDKLKQGGPDLVRGTKKVAKNTKRQAVKLLLLRYLAGVDGPWTGTLQTLKTEALLAEVEEGRADAKCPRTTLKRALAELRAEAFIGQTVERVGRTYRTTFVVLPAGRAWLEALSRHEQSEPQSAVEAPSTPASTAPSTPASGATRTVTVDLQFAGNAAMSVSQVQSVQSTWGPRRLPAEMLERGGVQGSGSSLLGGGPGEGIPEKISEPATTTTASPSAQGDNQPAEAGSPENDQLKRVRRPHQRALALDGQRLEPRRRRQPRSAQMPPFELVLPLVDSTIGTTLSERGKRELFVRAYEGLRPRPRVLRDVAAALNQRARRLLKKYRWDFEAAGRPKPTSTPPLPTPPHDTRDTESAVADFRQLLASAGKPLHERPVLDRARRLHDEGLSVIPLFPRTKKPAVLEWESAQTTRPTVATVAKRLAQLGEHAGLAVICGAVSGVVVVDLDDASAVEWAQAHLPSTPWRTKTGRAGGGEHWYFRAPATLELPEKLPFQGSVQADGRYVVAPGSIHPDTGAVYVALGDWGRPREELPRFDRRWFIGVDELRAARAKVLKRE